MSERKKIDKKELRLSSAILLIIKSENYNNNIIEFVKKIDDDKLCYVTINKTAHALINFLDKQNINSKNFSFIDCVSNNKTEKDKLKNCIYLNSPHAITDLNIAIDKNLDSNSNIIILDSLSSLLIYHKPEVIHKFIHRISTKAQVKDNKTLILTISDKDYDARLLKEAEVLVDRVKRL